MLAERLMNAPQKQCVRCEFVLDLENFTPHARGRDGLQAACKACESERSSIYKHNLTSLEKDQIAEAQGGCAICGRTDPGRKGWVVDHDRTCCATEKSCDACRRGILCQWCNCALGYARDNPIALRRMAAYLESDTRLATPNRSTKSYVHNAHNVLTQNLQPTAHLDSSVTRARAYRNVDVPS